MIKILYFNDCLGTSCGMNAEQEADYLKHFLGEILFEGVKFSFKNTHNLLDAFNENYDIMFFDFGGIGIGASDTAYSFARGIFTLLKDNPNRLFVSWSAFTNNYLEEECEKELGTHCNLICLGANVEETISKIQDWIYQ